MNQLLERERNRGMNFLNHQIITVIESASDFFTGRLTKKERKGTNASEVLFDLSLADYSNKKKNVLSQCVSVPYGFIHIHMEIAVAEECFLEY
ncbi:uncharacterized protein LOC126720639 isoform X3 [Quercus robur]|uniref:uncharacterized protein LOC126720639 isoform X3 n=1 Tax=Quercus robur TaxID=38942 RepID=UPI002163EA63|nr:uncharacterized protein LOC126720639 isoform X3 [Quercus robur]